jgi:flagellar basal-body rod protein FlgG
MTLRALSIAAAGGRAYLHQIDLLSANIAHAETVGYKRTRAIGPTTETLFEQGKLKVTQRELDLAVEGEGFLRVLMPDQTVAYTRAGNLRLDNDRNLVTADGYLIDPPVMVPEGFGRLVIDPSGLVQGFDGDELQELGRIELTTFANPSGLQPAGTTLFRETAAAGERIDGAPGVIRQGHLEQSNVDHLRELAELVRVQRSYELNSRMMQAADEILQSINNLRRKS